MFYIDFTQNNIFNDPQSIFLDGAAKLTLNMFLNKGTKSIRRYSDFHEAVHFYFLNVVE